MSVPYVSLVTPTYNRRRFIPSLIRIVEQQTYPRDKMEWIIYDDGQEEVRDLFEAAKDRLPVIRFIHSEDKMTLGEKRNRLNEEATGAIIVAIDDDDYYFPERVEAAVKTLLANPKVHLVGSSEVYMYFSDAKEIYKVGPYFPNHATNGTMAWTNTYAKTHKYDETVVYAEERSFLKNYSSELVQLPPMKVMLVISHSDNTFDKRDLRTAGNPLIVKTNFRLEDFIQDLSLREFFASS